MPILAYDKREVPVTVTLKAETMMVLMAAAVKEPEIQADEVEKIKDAITTALGI